VRTEKDFPVAWAETQNNLGGAYGLLPTGDRTANLQKAIAALEAALRVKTERDYPDAWAIIQNNLGNAYADLPARDRAANLQKAIGAYEAALRVRTEKDFPATWAETHATSAKRMPSFQTGIARRI
jgi:tetratricopeptide (TPR) repeat protein